MKTGKIMPLLLIAALLSSCTSTYEAMKPDGERALAVTLSGQEYEGELLSFQECTLYLLMKPEGYVPIDKRRYEVYALPADSLYRVTIEGINGRDWIPQIILFQAIPTLLFTLAASAWNNSEQDGVRSSVDVGEMFLSFAVPTAITWLLFEISTPPAPEASAPIDDEQIRNLVKYARYPQGMSEETMHAYMLRNPNAKISLIGKP
ncbi:MAG: hypothetical protein CL946_01060 [Ectothiorhodospiraceae bacterium]|nr:hypothetical protein [Ectothiorhodospiraceae bacterium]